MREPVLGRQAQIAVDLLQMGIDQDGRMAFVAGQKVGLAATRCDLFKNHREPPTNENSMPERTLSVSQDGAERPVVFQHMFSPHGAFSGAVFLCIDQHPYPAARAFSAA